MPTTETMVILFAVLVLSFSRGMPAFAKALGEIFRGLNVGDGLRNTFGRRVFEALTPENKTAELHDPPDKIPPGIFLFGLFFSLFALVALAIYLTVNKFI